MKLAHRRQQPVNGVPRSVRYAITLEGPAGADSIHTLRHVLKALLRRHQLRCTHAEEIKIVSQKNRGVKE
jgi:hypothetical protein